MGCVSGVEPAMVLGNSQQREKLKLEAVYIHPKLQVLKMEVLNLTSLFCGRVFPYNKPYPYSLYRWYTGYVPLFSVPEMFGDILRSWSQSWWWFLKYFLCSTLSLGK